MKDDADSGNTPDKPRSRIQQRNRKVILDAALDVFSVEGYRLMETWLDPLRQINPNGEPLDELLAYIRRKVRMSRQYPRESRLFANEILQGAPRMKPHLKSGLKPLFDDTCALIQGWMDAGKLAPSDPQHLIFSIWSTTQHYADFDAQVRVLTGGKSAIKGGEDYLDTLFRKLLTP